MLPIAHQQTRLSVSLAKAKGAENAYRILRLCGQQRGSLGLDFRWWVGASVNFGSMLKMSKSLKRDEPDETDKWCNQIILES